MKIRLIEDDGCHITLCAEINGKNAELLVDTGASRTVFDLERIKAFVSASDFKPHHKLSTGLGTNSMETQAVMIESLTLGELLISNHEAILLDLRHVNESYSQLELPEIDGVIGSDILLAHKAIIDFAKRKITFYIEQD